MRATADWVDITTGQKKRVQKEGNRRESLGLFKVVNDSFLAAGFEHLFHKFDMEWVHLVGLLRLFARKDQVQSDLVTLINHGAFAGGHASDVETQNAFDRAQIFLRSGDELLGGVVNFRAGPEDDNMGKHKQGSQKQERFHGKPELSAFPGPRIVRIDAAHIQDLSSQGPVSGRLRRTEELGLEPTESGKLDAVKAMGEGLSSFSH